MTNLVAEVIAGLLIGVQREEQFVLVVVLSGFGPHERPDHSRCALAGTEPTQAASVRSSGSRPSNRRMQGQGQGQGWGRGQGLGQEHIRH